MPKKDDKKATHLTKYFDLNYIVETIYYNKVPKYAVMNGKGPEILDFVKPNDNLWLKPYTDPFGNLDKGSILLPTAILDYGTTDKLLDEIRDFISTYCYLPDFWLELSSYYALMTWVYDAFTSVPYLEFLGDKDSGKTRIAKCIAECSYNSIKMSGAGSIPALFRLVDRFRGSLFIDEADYKDSEFDSAIAKIVNSGYTRDGVVWRCDVFEKDYEPRAYSVYGPKILSHREQYKDDATGSRCISFIVPKNSDIQTAKDLQGKRIATSYPNSVRKYLDKEGVTADIHTISGSVEIAPSLDLADAIADIVSTGNTLFQNNLREVFPFLYSEAVLIKGKSFDSEKQPMLNQLVFRIQSVLAANENKYILLNAPKDQLATICEILPGMKSPTILPLAIDGWVSVHSVVKQKEVWQIVQQLKTAGAEGILVCPIEKMVS